MTYEQLAEQAGGIRRALADSVAPDGIVAIMLDRDGPAPYAAQLAVLAAGSAYTCIDPGAPDGHVTFVLEDAQPTAIVTDSRHAARARRLGGNGTVVEIDRLPDDPGKAAAIGDPLPSERDLAYVIYTSGTTGRPKGVMIEHRSVANLVASDIETFALTPRDRVAQGSSLVYDSSIEETWLAWAAGATLVVMDEHAARLGPDLIPWLRAERISVICPPPTLLRATGCESPDQELPDLRLVYLGGEPLPADVAATWGKGRWLENGYGPTECTVTVVRGRVEPGDPITIGRAIRGHQAHVLDRTRDPVADGAEGELCLSGVGLARGYLGRPDLTDRSFTEHPEFGRLYLTGDLVRREPDGALTCLGRIDTQVKIRGHRLELEGVEATLSSADSIREAACRVEGGGTGARLVAYVVSADPGSPIDEGSLRTHVRASLPEAAVPSRFVTVPALPRSAGDKLDRRALEATESLSAPPATGSSTPVPSAADSALERAVAEAVAAALDIEGPGLRDDFFDALGGDSLRAAMVVSRLRRDPRTAAVAVRDIYETRTIAGIARRLESGAADQAHGTAPATYGDRKSPFAASVIQFLWLSFQTVTSAPILWFAAFLVFPFLLRTLGVAGSLILGPFIALTLISLWIPIGLGLAVLCKRILIGKYEAGSYPVWGSFYVRNWIVQQMVRFVPWGFLSGTVFMNAALRALGARIGERVHIHRGVDVISGGWDLLEIGDDVSLGRDAAVRVLELAAGHVVLGPITIERGATLDVRASVSGGCTVAEDAYLEPLSTLSTGTTLARGRRASGVPAVDVGPTPPVPEVDDARSMSPRGHGVLMIALGFLSGMLLYVPMLTMMLVAVSTFDLDADVIISWLFDPTFSARVMGWIAAITLVGPPLGLVLSAWFSRALGRVPAGCISRWSLAYIRIWMKVALVEGAGRWLSGTLLWPIWLRHAGMNVGRGCEISTITGVIPELVTIEGPSFLADGIYLGEPVVHRGTVRAGTVDLARNTFLGNHVVLPPDTVLAQDVLLGVCTVADPTMNRADSAWFGHPAFALPRREIVTADRSMTHDPSAVRWLVRATWEFARFLLPLPPVFAALWWFSLIGPRYLTGGSIWPQWGVIIIVTSSFAIAFAAAIVALKWVLLGRVKPGQHPLWSGWCSRWDFLYVAWGFYARSILAPFEGTLALPWYLRAMGASIGRRTVLGGGFTQVVDPDMLRIEDEATVSCMFQAHSFEDRVLKIDRVRIGKQSTVRHAAVLLYGADIGDRTDVAPHSVVMKQEVLLPDRRYEGCPVRPA